MPKFATGEGMPREAYELLRSSKTARYGGGGLWMHLQHRAHPVRHRSVRLRLDQIEESDDAFVIDAMMPLSVLESHADFARATNGVFTAAARDMVDQFATSRPWAVACPTFGFSDVLCALLALECEVKFTGAGRMSLADLCEEGYPRDVLERVVVVGDPIRPRTNACAARRDPIPVVNVAAAYWGDEWHVAVGARSCRARLLNRLPSWALSQSAPRARSLPAPWRQIAPCPKECQKTS